MSAEKRLGRAVRELRERRGWSQRQLAQVLAAAGSPMTQSMVAKTEAGDRPVRLDEAEQLAWVLHVSLFRLVGGPQLTVTELEDEMRELALREQELRDQIADAEKDAERARGKVMQLRSQLEDLWIRQALLEGRHQGTLEGSSDGEYQEEA